MAKIVFEENTPGWGHSIMAYPSGEQLVNVLLIPRRLRDGRQKPRDLTVDMRVQDQRLGDVINDDRRTEELYKWIEEETLRFAQMIALKIASATDGNLHLMEQLDQ